MAATTAQHRFLTNLLHSKSKPENRFPHRSKMVAPDPSTMHSFLAYRQNECFVIGNWLFILLNFNRILSGVKYITDLDSFEFGIYPINDFIYIVVRSAFFSA